MSEVKNVEEYPCQVQDVFSGDDLVVFIDLGTQDLWMKKRVRLAGVDTPNAVNETAETTAGKVRREVRALVRGKRGRLRVVSKGMGSWVVILTVEGPAPSGLINLNQHLIDQGYVFMRKQ